MPRSGRRPSPSLGPPAASRRAHEPWPAQVLWAPLPLPAVAPNDVLRLGSASTASITRSATNAASRCRRLLGAMLVSVLRPIGRLIIGSRPPPKWARVRFPVARTRDKSAAGAYVAIVPDKRFPGMYRLKR